MRSSEKYKTLSGRKNVNIRYLVLGIIAATGLIALGTVAPEMAAALASVGFVYKADKKYYTQKTLSKLIAQGLVRLEKNRRGVKCVRLTPLGQAKLRRYELGEVTIPRPRKWDGKYRVIIFDIKEWKRGTRNELRQWLERLGFVRLQNSVWVYPYECREVVTLLKSSFRLGNEVLYLTVEEMENDKWLRREFGLPLR